MEKSAEIYGIRAVIEAINSKKDIDKVDAERFFQDISENVSNIAVFFLQNECKVKRI